MIIGVIQKNYFFHHCTTDRKCETSEQDFLWARVCDECEGFFSTNINAILLILLLVLFLVNVNSVYIININLNSNEKCKFR